MNILEARGISKSYSNHVALRDVSVDIPKQTIFGLLGPNGAGKTTFIRIINQIIAADEGEIKINGERLNPTHIANIGYLPEERGLYKKMKVGEQLMYLGQLRNLNKAQVKEKIKYWFKKFEIADWWNKKVEDLSKGMQQKIQFIATVLHDPELIILDEPFSGFDPVNVEIIKKEILELRERGSTIIFSTHRMESVEQICDHMMMINKSRKILDGTTKSVRDQYKSNTFLVDHKGKLESLNGTFELQYQESKEDNLLQSTITITNGQSVNDLLRTLVDQVEVHGLIEKIPSIHEIFIANVKGDSDE